MGENNLSLNKLLRKKRSIIGGKDTNFFQFFVQKI
jgi:hypothetical protein